MRKRHRLPVSISCLYNYVEPLIHTKNNHVIHVQLIVCMHAWLYVLTLYIVLSYIFVLINSLVLKCFHVKIPLQYISELFLPADIMPRLRT